MVVDQTWDDVNAETPTRELTFSCPLPLLPLLKQAIERVENSSQVGNKLSVIIYLQDQKNDCKYCSLVGTGAQAMASR